MYKEGGDDEVTEDSDEYDKHRIAIKNARQMLQENNQILSELVI